MKFIFKNIENFRKTLAALVYNQLDNITTKINQDKHNEELIENLLKQIQREMINLILKNQKS